MSGAGLQPPQREASAGCLRSLVGVAALAVLAPFALLIRSFRVWRRGAEIRVERTRTELDVAGGGRLNRIDTAADVPAAAVDGFRRRLTDTVVRVAEALRRSDDIYHVLFRDPPAAETVVLPVGPQLQELGERFFLVLSEGAMAGRTAVWLTLPRGRRVVELVDPFEYDPEGSGEPERLLVRSGMRWGMATAFDRRGPAVLYRVVLYVPIEAADRVEDVLDRLNG